MKTIDSIQLKNKKALVRVDFNVPLNDKFEITDPTRIDAVIPTIQKIRKENGSVILMSHLGRPKKGPEDKFSLKHLLPYLSEKLNTTILFAEDCIGVNAQKLSQSLKPKDILLLENLRFYKEETEGNFNFAKKLAELGDIYVNDAFGTAHRAHASTAIIAQFFNKNKVFGYLLENEIKNINKILKEPKRPFTGILGGAKISGKIEVINQLLEKVDQLIIGGGMMFTFIKAMGGNIGKSMVENELLETANEVIEKAKANNVKLYIPLDAKIANDFSNDSQVNICSSYDIPENWIGLDIGPKSIDKFNKIIMDSSSILWNGPMGVFEMSNFEEGTKKIAEAVAKATSKNAFTLVGGGDSVAAINKYHLQNNISYLSTGGGAMLEYVEGKELPGIKAIQN